MIINNFHENDTETEAALVRINNILGNKEREYSVEEVCHPGENVRLAFMMPVIIAVCMRW